ncbi:DUF5908 family protein [Galbibacter sp. EGI 63066]|uniref:DUF5908 family protein n=1 Tax=Galbibacter sp. EGI 63066 TaxID=2993559 RepID=UPI002248A329|nr:DUF5908 family protein [Galbibacter sp. EGI 63066]MCX2680320.1 DUF5908 family protein [Galbibacter sp. EGI 63066]
MPIEIRELIIKAKVDNEGASTTASSSGSGNSEININEIAEQVLRIIKEKSER